MRAQPCRLLLVATGLLVPAGAASAQESNLGSVEFPTSAQAETAQAHFRRGVAALHSFWYPVALEEFRAARRAEPAFLMACWGEAMAHNHPVWGDPQETDAARNVLRNVTDAMLSKATARERAYVRAVRVLYGEGDKVARDKAYAAAMEQVHRKYPQDLEAAAFYALALLGTVRSSDLHDPSSTRTRMQAAAIAQEVYRRQPDHPGAAHYVIHAFDDPDHAILALPAARRYAEIAPAAPHALHMPSHIFLQLGMWPETAASNEASWTASDRWVQRRDLPVSQRDYHSLHWLLYAYLQQGRYQEAEDLLALMDRSLAEFPEEDPRRLMYGRYVRATMAATLVVETERWDAADDLVPAEPDQPRASSDGAVPERYQAFGSVVAAPAVFARGLSAAMQDSDAAANSAAELRAMRKQLAGREVPFLTDLEPVLEIQELEIAAARSAAGGDLEKAVRTMKTAASREDALPPSAGPPLLIKPAHELFGEILLRAERFEEASEQFAKSLFRHPGRARSLLGAARAAAGQEDRKTAEVYYARFLRQWQPADEPLPELGEARDYLTGARAD